MKVIFPFVGDSVGGSHKSALLLIENLIGNGVEVKVIVNQIGPLSRELEKRSIAYRRRDFLHVLPSAKRRLTHLGMMFVSMLKVAVIIWRLKPSAVHLNDARIQLTWVLPAFLLRVPSVWHQRTILSPSRLTRLLMKFTTAFICISMAVDRSMPSSTKKKRCVIFNPIQPVQVEHEVVSDRRASLLSGLVSPVVNTHLIGFVGNMRAVKRPEIFAKVIVDLNSRLRIPCVGVVIGEDRDGYTEKLERITRSINPPAEIILLGFQEDIEEWMPVCDVLIAPAVGEGFGRTLLEAMTLEVPVVASDSAGHKEIIHHCSNGLLVNSDNIGAFSNGVSELLSNKVFRKDIIAAGKKTARLYSTTKHSEGVRQVYASIKK